MVYIYILHTFVLQNIYRSHKDRKERKSKLLLLKWIHWPVTSLRIPKWSGPQIRVHINNSQWAFTQISTSADQRLPESSSHSQRNNWWRKNNKRSASAQRTSENLGFWLPSPNLTFSVPPAASIYSPAEKVSIQIQLCQPSNTEEEVCWCRDGLRQMIYSKSNKCNRPPSSVGDPPLLTSFTSSGD